MACTPIALTRVFLQLWTVTTVTPCHNSPCSAWLLSEPERRERAFTVLRGVQGRAETAFSGRWGPRSAAVTSPTAGQPSPKQGSEGCLEPCRQAFRWPGPRPGSFCGAEHQRNPLEQKSAAPVPCQPEQNTLTLSSEERKFPPGAFPSLYALRRLVKAASRRLRKFQRRRTRSR